MLDDLVQAVVEDLNYTFINIHDAFLLGVQNLSYLVCGGFYTCLQVYVDTLWELGPNFFTK